MNYSLIYDKLISRAKSRTFSKDTYKERHHILPRCLGGSDDSINLVDLTPEEHFLAHQLLVKINPGVYALVYAVTCMCVGHGEKRCNNKLYGWIRKLKRRHSPETIEKIRASNKGLKRSAEIRANISAAKKGSPSPRKGVIVSEESRLKMSLAKKGKKRGPYKPRVNITPS